MLVAAVPPTVTLLAPVKFAPLIVSVVPPAVDPLTGDTLVIEGGGFAVTVKMAPLLVTLPATFVILTPNMAPLSPSTVTGIV